MIKEYNYISINEVLSRLLRHPLLQDVDTEQAVQYTVDFIYKVGSPTLFKNKEEVIHIKDFRGVLPCDLISIIQVKDNKTNVCLRSMTDSFDPQRYGDFDELTFKTQGRIIYTSFKDGDITIAYKSIPLDDDGFPLLIDNAVFLDALEAYIKKQAFTILFDMGKINQNVLNNTQQEYAWKVGQLCSEMNIPSLSEMESIARDWTSMIPRMTEFDRGFHTQGNREYLKLH